MTYSFTFTDLVSLGQIDGTGSFVTGDAAVDQGYFLLTSLTYTSIRVNGALQTGSAVQTQFVAGSAYDPTTGAFINHYAAGRTANDYGGGIASGSIGSFSSINSDPTDFQQFDSGLAGEAFRPSGGGYRI